MNKIRKYRKYAVLYNCTVSLKIYDILLPVYVIRTPAKSVQYTSENFFVCQILTPISQTLNLKSRVHTFVILYRFSFDWWWLVWYYLFLIRKIASALLKIYPGPKKFRMTTNTQRREPLFWNPFQKGSKINTE
jgi:hypothetical protein